MTLHSRSTVSSFFALCLLLLTLFSFAHNATAAKKRAAITIQRAAKKAQFRKNLKNRPSFEETAAAIKIQKVVKTTQAKKQNRQQAVEQYLKEVGSRVDERLRPAFDDKEDFLYGYIYKLHQEVELTDALKQAQADMAVLVHRSSEINQQMRVLKENSHKNKEAIRVTKAKQAQIKKMVDNSKLKVKTLKAKAHRNRDHIYISGMDLIRLNIKKVLNKTDFEDLGFATLAEAF